MKKTAFLVFVLFMIVGCNGKWGKNTADVANETTLTAEQIALLNTKKSYGYYPLDPLPINVTCKPQEILENLPDETMRLAIGELTAGASVSYTVASASVKGSRYVVILDYIKFETDFIETSVQEQTLDGITTKSLSIISPQNKASKKTDLLVPAYVGVGVRLSAYIQAFESGVDLGGLFGIGAAAEAKKISGTLVIQTLGLSGPGISDIIPMPVEISRSSIQNAIMALASIKAKMYDLDKRYVHPRVIGIYNNVDSDSNSVYRFIAQMLKTPITFPKE
ncbi:MULTISPECIES: hypothetical protein [unclassified Pseudodesulfovibrio]|uniref:hypothetical protein n=1 Tax=unclassified Pseudodesulfovibrio TaxID=2661612 RepID=UPI000FEC134C|nr:MULTISPECIES: hypothetical protein [unclassified Pseudodesulfovibrio]MCJ2164674.1 hypothetical protein [Pseudodesulfovibrio sp. S3-i]RWU04134.1 hypothetical protein DWB63_09005 [Pseudodesulfovibrio sp. S3]